MYLGGAVDNTAPRWPVMPAASLRVLRRDYNCCSPRCASLACSWLVCEIFRRLAQLVFERYVAQAVRQLSLAANKQPLQ